MCIIPLERPKYHTYRKPCEDHRHMLTFRLRRFHVGVERKTLWRLSHCWRIIKKSADTPPSQPVKRSRTRKCLLGMTLKTQQLGSLVCHHCNIQCITTQDFTDGDQWRENLRLCYNGKSRPDHPSRPQHAFSYTRSLQDTGRAQIDTQLVLLVLVF